MIDQPFTENEFESFPRDINMNTLNNDEIHKEYIFNRSFSFVDSVVDEYSNLDTVF